MERRPAQVWMALATIYLIWGSTYLAIRLAIDSIPPLLMASVRFLIAGALLYGWAIGRGDRRGDRPSAGSWGAAALTGGLLFLVGNGGVSAAERNVPTGVVALIIALIPMWLALLDRVINGQRLAAQAVVGLVLGFGGLVLLVGVPAEGGIPLSGALIAVGASLGWATGTLLTNRVRLPRRAPVANAMQMLAGGALLAVAATAAGELGELDLSRVTLGSMVALAYLVVFGSLVAFTAYMWLIRRAPLSTVATYAYVNPVVAVLLGWLFLNEAVTARVLVAGVVIVVAVAMIITAPRVVRLEAPPAGAVEGAAPAPAPGRTPPEGPWPRRAASP